MSIFSAIGAWFSKVFASIKHDIAPTAVSITEGIKVALDSGTIGFIASIVDAIFKTSLPSTVVDLLKVYIPKVLEVELAIQGLPDNPTEQDILDFENRVIASFGKVDDKSKLYTTIAASIYGHVKNALEDDKITFAEAVAIIEASYQDYLTYLDENPQDKPTVQ